MPSNISLASFQEVRGAANKSSEVARQLLSAIITRRYRPEEKLPAERLLAQQMKVSRTCIREALNALRVLGVVQRRVGDGTYVLASEPDVAGFSYILSLHRAKEEFLDVWETRTEIEAVIVKLCIESATPMGDQTHRALS